MTMQIPENVLINVATYQKAELAWMLNSNVAINISNKKFKNFNEKTANLGDRITFDLAPRSYVQAGLVVDPQESDQRLQTLICSQAANSSSAFSEEQFIFNVSDYMDRFGRSRIQELGTFIESDILKNINSSCTIINPRNPSFGQIADPTSGPYRFYGNGVSPINSVGQLAQAVSNFDDYGAAQYKPCGILPMTVVPSIVNSALNQFVIDRNEEFSASWMLGMYQNVQWYKSNLLPKQYAGTVGNSTFPSNQLTLVSVNDPSGNNITQLTLSGATPSDLNAIKNGDLAFFIDSVSGVPDVRYRTFQGHQVSNQPVQIRVIGDTPADSSGNVTINIYPALQSTPGNNQNLSTSLRAGMKLQFLPSHQCGLLMSGEPLYLAMPKQSWTTPFPGSTLMDSETGASIRNYFGFIFGQAQLQYVYDSIWGSTLVAENCMRLVFPLNQSL